MGAWIGVILIAAMLLCYIGSFCCLSFSVKRPFKKAFGFQILPQANWRKKPARWLTDYMFPSRNDWTEEQTQAAIDVYFVALLFEFEGQPKAAHIPSTTELSKLISSNHGPQFIIRRAYDRLHNHTQDKWRQQQLLEQKILQREQIDADPPHIINLTYIATNLSERDQKPHLN